MYFPVLTAAAGWVVVGFVGLLGLNFLYRVYTNDIDLKDLISEVNGGASLSRLQFLIFTFVISMSLFIVIAAHSGAPILPDIPPSIIGLLGISGGSYVVSKGIQFSNPAGITDTKPVLILSAVPAAPLPAGGTADFSVIPPAGTAVPAITWSLDAPAHGTLSTGTNKVTYTAPAVSPGAGTKVTIRAKADGFTDASAVLELA